MKALSRFRIAGMACVAFTLCVGVAIGHRSNIPLPRDLAASIARARPPNKMADLAARVDPAQAELSKGELIQRLSDNTRVVFTIDPDLQAWTSQLLRDYEVPYGAVVAYDLESGETLLLSGYSQQNPRISSRELCLTPWAPAASVFKLVSASALLSLGVPESTSVCYHGGGRGITAQHLRSNPSLDRSCDTLRTAVARSINPVIAKLADRHVSPRLLTNWAERFGFNQPIPFDLPVEPSRAAIPEQRLEFARAAAGFWHTDISALHGAVMAGIALNDGILRWPHVVRRVETVGNPAVTPQPAPGHRVLSRSVSAALARMMEDTTRMGTAARAFRATAGPSLPEPIRIGGKTGSLDRHDPFLSYSWFVGFAQAGKRKVAIGVLLGNPPRWRIKAPTVARLVLARLLG